MDIHAVHVRELANLVVEHHADGIGRDVAPTLLQKVPHAFLDRTLLPSEALHVVLLVLGLEVVEGRDPGEHEGNQDERQHREVDAGAQTQLYGGAARHGTKVRNARGPKTKKAPPVGGALLETAVSLCI